MCLLTHVLFLPCQRSESTWMIFGHVADWVTPPDSSRPSPPYQNSTSSGKISILWSINTSHFSGVFFLTSFMLGFCMWFALTKEYRQKWHSATLRLSPKETLLISSSIFFFLPCHMGYGILVPQPRIEPLQWKCKVLTTGPPGNFLLLCFLHSYDLPEVELSWSILFSLCPITNPCGAGMNPTHNLEHRSPTQHRDHEKN